MQKVPPKSEIFLARKLIVRVRHFLATQAGAAARGRAAGRGRVSMTGYGVTLLCLFNGIDS